MSDRMTPREFEELDQLFQQAADLPVPEQRILVEEVRRRSATVAERLLEMLRADATCQHTLDAAVSEVSKQVAETEDPLIGERFGPYRVESVLGRGGMGAVYLGRRVDGNFRQVAAIKTVRYGLDGPDLVARFHREREILARMDHPGIARLLDGGTGARGLPFVAMEYVDGLPLTEYVEANDCSLRERLRLFVDLCDAVGFVHRNLIVHRDIKPGNVLVTPDGRVKLLDFGIARLTDEFGIGGTATATQMRAMTPEYASPEQILGKTVTTSTDIYALGVLLYEMLTGDRPIRFDSQNPYALAQAIAEHAPTIPSEYLKRSSRESAASFHAHPRQLRGDLDRIAMMALRKEPERRYPSAAMLAEDVRRYLEGRPVEAQVDSWHYRLRKFLQRHPVASSVAALLLAVVLGFSLLTQRQSHRIAAERDRAVEAEAQSAASADFLEDLFNVADPRNGGDRSASALDMLYAGLERLDSDDSIDPSLRADMYLTIGLILCNLEEFDAGIRSMENSVALHEAISGRDSLPTAEALHRLGDVLRRVERFDDAFAMLSEALEIRERHITGGSYEIADSYNNLAILAAVMGQHRKSEELQAASIEMHTRVFGEDAAQVATPLNNMALLKRRQGRIEEAYELSRRSYEIKVRESSRTDALLAQSGMARSLHLMGRHDEALVLFDTVLSGQTLLLGETHTRRLTTARRRAMLLIDMGRYEDADRQLEETEPLIVEAHGERSTRYARWLSARALLDWKSGDLERAERRARLAGEIHDERTGPFHFGTTQLWFQHGAVLTDLERYAEAEEVLQRTLEHLPAPEEYPHILRVKVLDTLARVWNATGSPDQATQALEESREIANAVEKWGHS